MSLTLEPATEPRLHSGGRINLVAKARPYFGLIVLTTTLLTVYGVVAMLRMPSGIYPEVAFPRIVVIAQTPGLAGKDVEVAGTVARLSQGLSGGIDPSRLMRSTRPE